MGKRDQSILIRLTAQELDAIRRASGLGSRSISHQVRQWIREGIEKVLGPSVLGDLQATAESHPSESAQSANLSDAPQSQQREQADSLESASPSSRFASSSLPCPDHSRRRISKSIAING